MSGAESGAGAEEANFDPTEEKSDRCAEEKGVLDGFATLEAESGENQRENQGQQEVEEAKSAQVIEGGGALEERLDRERENRSTSGLLLRPR